MKAADAGDADGVGRPVLLDLSTHAGEGGEHRFGVVGEQHAGQLGAALGQPGTQQGPVGQAFRAGQDDGGVGGLGQAAQAEGVDDHRATLRGGQPPTYPLPEA